MMKLTFHHWLALFLITVITLDLILPLEGGRVQYQFKRYTYKKKRDDKKYKSLKSQCELNPDCLAHRNIQQTICIRKCISEVCYQELYGSDPLEDGEIDVRLNSFKGCLHQHANEAPVNHYTEVVFT